MLFCTLVFGVLGLIRLSLCSIQLLERLSSRGQRPARKLGPKVCYRSGCGSSKSELGLRPQQERRSSWLLQGPEAREKLRILSGNLSCFCLIGTGEEFDLVVLGDWGEVSIV